MQRKVIQHHNKTTSTFKSVAQEHQYYRLPNINTYYAIGILMFTAKHTTWKEIIQASVMSTNSLHTQSSKRTNLNNMGTEGSKQELLKYIVIFIPQITALEHFFLVSSVIRSFVQLLVKLLKYQYCLCVNEKNQHIETHRHLKIFKRLYLLRKSLPYC